MNMIRHYCWPAVTTPVIILIVLLHECNSPITIRWCFVGIFWPIRSSRDYHFVKLSKRCYCCCCCCYLPWILQLVSLNCRSSIVMRLFSLLWPTITDCFRRFLLSSSSSSSLQPLLFTSARFYSVEPAAAGPLLSVIRLLVCFFCYCYCGTRNVWKGVTVVYAIDENHQAILVPVTSTGTIFFLLTINRYILRGN